MYSGATVQPTESKMNWAKPSTKDTTLRSVGMDEKRNSNEKSHTDSKEITKCSTYTTSTRTHIRVHSKFASGPDPT